MKLTTNLLKESAALTSFLTVLAMMPYEKDLMGLIPPSWAPKIAAVSAIATVALRLLPRILAIFGIVIPSNTPTIAPPSDK